MNLLSIITLCLISCTPALSADLEAGLQVRQDPSQTVTLTQPSPTSTNPDVVAAYATYSQKCGPDLNTATQAALKTYESVTQKTGVSISDPDFISWASTGFPDYMTATQACTNALLDYKDALANAGSGSSNVPSSSTPAPSSTPPSQPSSSPASAPPNSQPSSSPTSAPPNSGGPSSSPPAQPSQSKPASAAFHGPSWALALAGLAAVLYIS